MHGGAGPSTRRGLGKGPHHHLHQPWWSKPSSYFYITSACFWGMILWNVLDGSGAADGADPRELRALPCNIQRRPLATCAHRGNAAELLKQRHQQTAAWGGRAAAGGGSSAPGEAQQQQASSVVGQMALLWEAGITCFDYDAVELKDGELLVGHPTDLAARVDAAKLGTASSSSSSSRKARVDPALLPSHTLQQLRAAGLGEADAPTLGQVMARFSGLLRAAAAARGSSSSSRVAANTTVAAAAVARSWRQVAVLNVEVKGPAAMTQQAWQRAADAAAKAGITEHTILWMRQIPAATAQGAAAGGSGSSDAASKVVTHLARDLKKAFAASAASSSGGGGNSSSTSGSKPQGGPLLGLIVADMLLQQQHLVRAAALRDDYALGAALLATAGGLTHASPSSSTSSPSPSSTSSSDASGAAAGGAAGSGIDAGAPAVLAAFDVLALSIKLPAAVLDLALRSKPCMAWTLETQRQYRKAMYLGIDVGITNTPIAQEDAIRRLQDGLCGSS